MKNLFISLLCLFSFFSGELFGQEEQSAGSDSIEVYIIDSYVPPENPNRFILSFYTSEPCKTKLLLENGLELPISTELTDNHRTEIDLSKIKSKKNKINYTISMENGQGIVSKSETFEMDVKTTDEIVETKSNYFLTCLAGGIVFLTPSVAAVSANGKNYFELNKEIPLVSMYSGGFNYPSGYFSIEYSYIFKALRKSYLRFGYKHLYEIPKIEYLSPGLNGYSDLKGNNGISPELSVGLFKIYNVFTLYTRYRYNFSPGHAAASFSEFSLGLYSSFFTFHW